MAKQFKIYLAGSIPKGDKERDSFYDWKADFRSKISKAIPDVVFLDPDLIRDTVGPELVVGHDLWLIDRADLIIVNIPEKVGAGTAQEMVIAKSFEKPVVTVLPQNSHHRRSNIVFDGETIEDWIHPFLYVSSDVIAETIDDAMDWIKSFTKNLKGFKPKNMAIYRQMVDKFERELDDVYKAYLEKGW